MSGQISEDKIDQVRDRSNIVELVSQYVNLKSAGRNHVGLCPFHAEKTPSFSVNAERQFFHCFGCGAGGDVFSFLMQSEGLSFPDAVRKLADRAGIDLEEQPLTPHEKELTARRERLFRINELAADYFHDQLLNQPQAEKARAYLKARGYGKKTAAEYRIGFAPEGWTGLKDHLQQHQVDSAEAIALGLVREGQQGRGDYDMFRGRLMFPIADAGGRIVAFAGRVLDDGKPKYINSPESPIYHKGSVLFGLYQARQAMRVSGDALVVEGYFDQMALQRAGFAQTVATCGTALTTEHVKLLGRYAKRVVLVFDQDRAGRQATFKAMDILRQEGVPAAAVTLPSGDDPDSLLRRQGAAAFQARLEAARPVMELFMEETLAGAQSVEFRVRGIELILEKIAALGSELEQDLYLKELSRLSTVDVTLLQQKLARLGSHRRRSEPLRPEPPPLLEPPNEVSGAAAQRSARTSVKTSAVSRAEEALVRLLLCSSAVRSLAADRGGSELVDHPDVAAIVRLILQQSTDSGCDVSRLLPELSASQCEILVGLSARDPGEFAENPEQAGQDCLQLLQRMKWKKRADQLALQLIPAADADGDAARADSYRNELSQLQLQIKKSSGGTKKT